MYVTWIIGEQVNLINLELESVHVHLYVLNIEILKNVTIWELIIFKIRINLCVEELLITSSSIINDLLNYIFERL